MPKLDEYLRIKQAAEYLGVSQNTLRNWEAAGKINVRRHPMNRYRLYRVSDLDKVLRETERSSRKKRKPRWRNNCRPFAQRGEHHLSKNSRWRALSATGSGDAPK